MKMETKLIKYIKLIRYNKLKYNKFSSINKISILLE